jgi:integral membrane protein
LPFPGHFLHFQTDLILDNYEKFTSDKHWKITNYWIFRRNILLILLFIAVPLKYVFAEPFLTRIMGTIHGALFLLFIFNAISVGVEQNWKFKDTTWKVLLACIIPFGTFYIDAKILSKIGITSQQ